MVISLKGKVNLKGKKNLIKQKKKNRMIIFEKLNKITEVFLTCFWNILKVVYQPSQQFCAFVIWLDFNLFSGWFIFLPLNFIQSD